MRKAENGNTRRILAALLVLVMSLGLMASGFAEEPQSDASIENTVVEEQTVVTETSGEDSALPVEPVVDPAPVDPVDDPAPVDPVVDPAPVDPVDDPAPVDPVDDPAPVDPVDDPAPVEPVDDPTPVEPDAQPDGIPAEYFQIEGVENVTSPAEPLEAGAFETTAPAYAGYRYVSARVETANGTLTVTGADMLEQDGVQRVKIELLFADGETAEQLLPEDSVVVLSYDADAPAADPAPETNPETDPETEETPFAALSVEEQYAALQTMNEEEQAAALASLSEEQLQALSEYIASLAWNEDSGEEIIIPKNVTSVAPFLAPVTGQEQNSFLKSLFKAPMRSSAEQPDNGISLSKTSVYDEETGNTVISLEAYTTGAKIITEETTVVPTDIVLVLDISNSMDNNTMSVDPELFLPVTPGTNGLTFGVYYSRFESGDAKNNLWGRTADNTYTKITSVTRTGTSGNYTVTITYTIDGQMKTVTGKWAETPVFTDFLDSPQLYYRTDTITYMLALKIAATAFANSVIEKSENTNNRVAVVTFGNSGAYKTGSSASTALKNMDNASEADEVINAINGLTTSGATDPQTGLTLAKDIFDANPIEAGETRNRVVVFFTDGTPGQTDGTWNNTSTTRANAAIDVSDTLKGSYGATVYAVGIFNGADGTSNGTAYNKNTNTNNKTDVAAYGNYFMQYVSSNNGTPQTPSYYLSAGDVGSLSNIFTVISQQIEEGGSSTTLTEETVVKDIVSPYFTIPENASDVTLQTADYIGPNEWAKPVAAESVKATINGGTLNVSGFNFSENWVGTVTNSGTVTYRGKKLLISFTVPQDPNFLGGSAITTNGENSGLYENGDAKTPLATFEVPTVTVPLKQIDPTGAVWNVYLTTEDQLADQFSTLNFTVGGNEVSFSDLFDGENNAGVNVSFAVKDGSGNTVDTFTIPAGGTSGAWSSTMPILSDSSYTITCTVADAKGILPPKTAEAEIKLNVFKPILTFTDKNVYYQGALNVSTIEPTVQWKKGDTLDSDVTMHTTKPTLTYTYSVIDGTVDQPDDYTVAVTAIGVAGHTYDDIDLLSIEAEDAVTFRRSCEKESLNAVSATAEEAFKLHVYAPTLSFKDLEAVYGDTVTIPDYSTVNWKNDGVTMDNTAPEASITLSYTGVNEKGYVTVVKDISVKAVVTLGGTDVTQGLITAGKLTRGCDTDESHTEVTTDQAFVIHVKTLTLTIKKIITGNYANMNGTFDITVTLTPAKASGISTVEQTLTLGNNETKELTGLPMGDYTIDEGSHGLYTVYFKVDDNEPVKSNDGCLEGPLTQDTSVIVTNDLQSIPTTGVNTGSPLLGLCAVLFAGTGLIGLQAYVSRKNRRYRGRHCA